MRYRLDRVMEYLMALEQGASRESVAPLLGLTADMLEGLLSMGYQELLKHGPYKVESDAAIEADCFYAGRLCMYTLRAEARAELTLTQTLYNAAAAGSWKAAQKLLELRFPVRWANVKRTEARDFSNSTTKVTRPGLSDRTASDLRKKVLGLSKVGGGML